MMRGKQTLNQLWLRWMFRLLKRSHHWLQQPTQTKFWKTALMPEQPASIAKSLSIAPTLKGRAKRLT